MNRFNPCKLLNSKWTDIHPKAKEKHFIVVKVFWNSEMTKLIRCHLESVITKRTYPLTPEMLKDEHKWIQGWK